MSKIQTIQPNQFGDQRNRNANRNVIPPMTRKNSINMSFSGESLSKIQQNLIKDTLIKKYLGSVKMLGLGKFFNYLSETAGEIQNVVIQNLGTAFVAPIFIVNNPLSKESDDSKKYSAWRQPISALIAAPATIATNYAVTLFFDDAATAGVFKKFDMSAAPSEDYLKRRYGKILKALKGKDDISKVKFDQRSENIIKLFDKDKITDYEQFKDRFPTYQDFASEVIKKTRKIAAAKLLDPNNPNGLKNITLKDFLVEKLDFKASDIDPNQLNKDDVEIKLKNTKVMNFLRECGMNDLSEKEVRSYLGNNFYRHSFVDGNESNKKTVDKFFKLIDKLSEKSGINMSEDKEAYKNMLNEAVSNKGFDSKERKLVSRISQLLISEKTQDEETISMKKLLKIFDMDDNFYANEKLNWKMDKFLFYLEKQIKPEELKEKKGDIIAPGKDLEIPKILTEADLVKIRKYVENIAENGAKKAGSSLKTYNKVQGIIVSLIVLPFQCTFLNWAYPRIMEKCFPKLANRKADSKGGK